MKFQATSPYPASWAHSPHSSFSSLMPNTPTNFHELTVYLDRMTQENQKKDLIFSYISTKLHTENDIQLF